MSASVLVAYATIHGSTREVADAVATALRERGLAVNRLAAREVRSLAGYDAVVLGAPLYMFHWHRHARRFLARHRAALMERPVAIFALGPFNDVEEEWKGAREQLDKELNKFPWLAPVAKAVFGGKFDPTALRFPFSWLPAMKQIPATDIRDWTAIRAWAEGLAERLEPSRA